MRILVCAVLTAVSAAFIGDLMHSAVCGFASLVTMSAVFITVTVKRRRREAVA